MIRLYRPVPIETAEQAEALPIGTVATDLGSTIISAAVRTDVGLGWFVSGDEMTDMHEHLVGWTALVPIEADEPPVTAQPNRDQLREAAEGHLRFGGGGDDLAQGVLALLDQVATAEQRIRDLTRAATTSWMENNR